VQRSQNRATLEEATMRINTSNGSHFMLSFVCLSLIVIGCEKRSDKLDKWQSASREAEGIIADRDRTHDFGIVVGKPGKKLEWNYLLNNKTNDSFEITEQKNQKPCCGAITVDRKVYKPGDKGNIKIVMDVGSKYGGLTHTAEIITTCKTQPRIVLRTLAEVAPSIRIENAQAITQQPESVMRHSIESYFTVSTKGTLADPPIDLDRVKLSPDDKVEWCSKTEEASLHNALVEQRRTFVVRPTEKKPGDYKIEILLSRDGEIFFSYVHSWKINPPITTTPKVLVFSKSRTQQRVLLSSTDSLPFLITEVTTNNDSIIVIKEIIHDSSKQFLTFKTKGNQGMEKGVIKLQTNKTEQREVEIPFVFID
jgi:hypothetical protein